MKDGDHSTMPERRLDLLPPRVNAITAQDLLKRQGGDVMGNDAPWYPANFTEPFREIAQALPFGATPPHTTLREALLSAVSITALGGAEKARESSDHPCRVNRNEYTGDSLGGEEASPALRAKSSLPKAVILTALKSASRKVAPAKVDRRLWVLVLSRDVGAGEDFALPTVALSA